METGNDETTMIPHKWIPETDPVRCAVLLKLIEELNECATAAARCLMQGIDEREPVTGKLNREWLGEELADVLAMVTLTKLVENFAPGGLKLRVTKKFEMKLQWIEMLGYTRNGYKFKRLDNA